MIPASWAPICLQTLVSLLTRLNNFKDGTCTGWAYLNYKNSIGLHVYFILVNIHMANIHMIKIKANQDHAVYHIYFCLFVCLLLIVPLETQMETSPLPAKTANFNLCSALMAIEQWGFFSISYLLWYGASINNGDLRGPITLTPIAERLAMELSLPVFKT